MMVIFHSFVCFYQRVNYARYFLIEYDMPVPNRGQLRAVILTCRWQRMAVVEHIKVL